MSFSQAMAIRSAVTELLQGSIGTTRIVPMALFQSGVHGGQALYKQQVRALDLRYQHRFDISVLRAVPHEATALSVKTASRISKMAIVVNVTTKFKSEVLEDAREYVRCTVEGDCDTAIQALNYPNNLTTTSDGDATGIVSGMLLGPDSSGTPTWELVEENWSDKLLRSRIVCEAIVTQSQAVA